MAAGHTDNQEAKRVHFLLFIQHGPRPVEWVSLIGRMGLPLRLTGPRLSIHQRHDLVALGPVKWRVLIFTASYLGFAKDLCSYKA